MGLELENNENEMEKKSDIKKKPTKKTKEMLEENARQIEELKNEKVKLSDVLNDLEKEEADLGEKSALKMKVNHRKFGEGQVITQDGLK